MSDLLAIGRSGVIAYRAALSATGENVANAETEGFTRRTVQIKESGLSASSSYQYRSLAVFGGSNVGSVQRVYDDYRSAYARLSISEAARNDTKAQWLQTAEGALDDSDVGLGVKLSSVFTAAESLSTDVSSDTNRRTVLTAIQDVAEEFNSVAQRLDKTASGVITAARTAVDGLNGQLQALAQVNIGIRRAGSGTAGAAQLLDQRDALINQISGAFGVDVNYEDDGRANVSMAGNSSIKLVDSGKVSPAFIGVIAGGDGRISLVASGTGPQTAIAPQSGSLSGLVDVSNTIASRRQELDAIAANFSSTLNTWNINGVDRDGNPGAALMSGTTAATISVTTDDLAKIAAASTSGVGNGNALALKDTRTSTASEGRWALLVATHSQAVASAKAAQSATSAQKDGALLAVDEVTGVDLDVEAAQLLRFQQAYSGSAKIIQVARETLQEIMGLFN
jgi:flagellar hook-associated protein 1 FlgK